jgi:hypothetical protein
MWGTAVAALLTVAATACGSPGPAVTAACPSVAPVQAAEPTPMASIAAKTVKQTKKTAASPTKPTSKPAAGKPAAGTGSSSGGTTAPPPKADDDAEALFTAMREKVGGATSYIAVVNVIDNNKNKVKQTTSTLKISYKAPGSHRIDIQDTNNSLTKGGKMVFELGKPNAKLRPGGILGVALMDMALTDTMITTGCEWRLDQVVAVGLANRFASGYKAELAGQSVIAGETMKVLKVVAEGTNSLDSDIEYEHIGIDADNMLRYWAVYAKPGVKVPNSLMWQMTMNAVQLNVPVADSAFTI